MKLQGVEILRISDFRRFFNIEEFIQNKRAFANLFSTVDLESFCDTAEERALCSQLRLWCMGQPLSASIDQLNKQVTIPLYGTIALGYVFAVQKQYESTIKASERIAMACLCLLLGAYCTESEATYIYNYIGGDKSMQRFVSVSANVDLEQHCVQTGEPCYRVVYANLFFDKEFVVKCGRRVEKLRKGECVVAIHTPKGCVALMPRTALASDLNARLMINPKTRQPYLSVVNLKNLKSEEKYKNVASFWIEEGRGLIYTTFDNQVKKAFGREEEQNDFSSCYTFNQEYKLFCKYNPNKLLLAISKTNGYYTFYSTTKQ